LALSGKILILAVKKPFFSLRKEKTGARQAMPLMAEIVDNKKSNLNNQMIFLGEALSFRYRYREQEISTKIFFNWTP
jgi:hypothetical protein